MIRLIFPYKKTPFALQKRLLSEDVENKYPCIIFYYEKPNYTGFDVHSTGYFTSDQDMFGDITEEMYIKFCEMLDYKEDFDDLCD